MRIYSIRLPDWLRRRLQDEADRRQEAANADRVYTRVHVSDVVREILTAYFAPLEQQKSR